MKILEVQSCWIPTKEYIIVEAMDNESAGFDSFLGEKLYRVSKGIRRKVRISKKHCLRAGDHVTLTFLVTSNQEAFSDCWDWRY
jgi:hypothetical protein